MVEMQYIFNSMYLVGKVFYERDTDTWSFERIGYGELSKVVMERFLFDYNSACIKESFAERTFPPNRVNASELLGLIKLDHYDLWEIMKRTHGVTAFDEIWLNDTTDTSWYRDLYRNHPEKIYDHY